ncbi:MAG: MBL fold metallo-hydrolase [Gordonia sp. (in: high G+C Gram-positive bacteria)]
MTSPYEQSAPSAHAAHEAFADFTTATAVTALGGPTVLIDIDGRRFVVDPTFDAAGEHPIGSRTLTKTADAVLGPDDLGTVDAVLLSHDQHPDNLDDLGRQFLTRVPVVFTTTLAAGRITATAHGLAPWETATLGATTITAVPAQHGPDGCEPLTGPVIGFVLTTAGAPTIYVSGDNASLDVVRQIAQRLPRPDLAIVFAGAARTPVLDGILTLTSTQALDATRILGNPIVLPVHTEGWAHFTENTADLIAAFTSANADGLLLDSTPGRRITVVG